MAFRGGDGEDVWAGLAVVLDEEGRDRTDAMKQGAEQVLQLARQIGATRAILKEKSPSCGVQLVTVDGVLQDGMGVCAYLLQTEGLELEKAGVGTDGDGLIQVDEYGRTSAATIYAVGDVTGGFQLAHAATSAGIVAAEHACGRSRRKNETVVPAVIFSMPEVATSITAAIKGERDIAVGNVVGSNTFNILGCLGLAGLVAPSGLPLAPSVLTFDIWVMLAVAIACLPVFFTGREIARWEGAVFLGYYAAYVAYLILAAQQHDALPAFSNVMLVFVIPLTLATLIAVLVRKRG